MPQRSNKWNGYVGYLLSGKNVRDFSTSHLPLIEPSGWIWSHVGKTNTTHNSAVATIWADIRTGKNCRKIRRPWGSILAKRWSAYCKRCDSLLWRHFWWSSGSTSGLLGRWCQHLEGPAELSTRKGCLPGLHVLLQCRGRCLGTTRKTPLETEPLIEAYSLKIYFKSKIIFYIKLGGYWEPN